MIIKVIQIIFSNFINLYVIILFDSLINIFSLGNYALILFGYMWLPQLLNFLQYHITILAINHIIILP